MHAGRQRHTTVCLSFVLLMLVVSTATAQEDVGDVAAIQGTADVLHPGAAARIEVALGADVLLGDDLRTHAASKLKLLFNDDSVLILGPESRLTVDKQVIKPVGGISHYSLWKGVVRAVVGERFESPGAEFEIRTPTAIVGVRGTVFIVSYDPVKQQTLVVCLRGKLHVRSRLEHVTGEVVLKARESTTVPKNRAPTPPVVIDVSTLQDLIEATQIRSGGFEPERELTAPGGALPEPEPIPASGLATDPRPPGEPAVGGAAYTGTQTVVDQPIPEIVDSLVSPQPDGPTKPSPPAP